MNILLILHFQLIDSPNVAKSIYGFENSPNELENEDIKV
jgi:hypothetical protein